MRAAACVLWFEVGGFLGTLFAGWSSDEFFGSKRNAVSALFTFGAIAMLLCMHWNGLNFLLLDRAIIFSIGFFIFGPQMLIGIASTELTSKKAAATSSGFVGCFAYMGAAVAGGPLGVLIASWGWDAFFAILCGCGVLALALLSSLWSIKTTPQPELQVEENNEKEII